MRHNRQTMVTLLSFDEKLEMPGLHKKTKDSLVTVMKQRFPNDKRIQEYSGHPKFPPATAHSDWVKQKLLQIMNERMVFKSKTTL